MRVTDVKDKLASKALSLILLMITFLRKLLIKNYLNHILNISISQRLKSGNAIFQEIKVRMTKNASGLDKIFSKLFLSQCNLHLQFHHIINL